MALVPLASASAPTEGADAGDISATVGRRIVAQQVRAAASVGADGQGTAVLYKDDLVGLAPQEPAKFFGTGAPNEGIGAHLLLDSQAPVDDSTVRVAFRLEEALPPEASGGPTNVGSIQIDPRARELLVVPTGAVLYSASGPYVLAAPQAGQAFARRSVQIGRTLDSGYVGGLEGADRGYTVVLSGLREGERVIEGYTFFVDAERRLREAHSAGGDGPR
jgi:hypothetical protein